MVKTILGRIWPFKTNNVQALQPEQIEKPIKGQKNFYRVIFREPEYRFRADEQMLKSAVEAAKNPYHPSRRELFDIYDMTMTDAQVLTVTNTRRLKLVEQPFKIVDDSGKEFPELTNKINRLWIRDLFEYIQESLFYGYSVIQLLYDSELKQVSVKLIPRRNVLIEKGQIIVREWDTVGFDYRQYSNIIEVGQPENLGLLEAASICYFKKRNALTAFDDTIEEFGRPTLTLQTNTTDENERDRAEEWLANMRESGAAIYDHDEKLEVHKGLETDVHENFLESAKYQDEQISKIFLGQTMTTDAGSSFAQSKTHEKVSGYYTAFDKCLLAAIMNDYVLPILPGFEGKRLQWLRYESMTQLELSQLYLNLKSLGFGFAKETIERDFGVELSDEFVEES